MDKGTEASMKELKRTLKYIIDTRNYGLIMLPIKIRKSWNLTTFCDSNYAGDRETQISVTGYILYLCRAPISWKSKAQRSITQSSSKVEFFAISEAVKEIRFVYQVMQTMKIEIELPIIVRVDNIGAIYIAENRSTTPRTKHIDIRTKFVNDYIDDGFIKIIFVKSEENDADIFTKNTTAEIQARNNRRLLGERPMT